MFFLTFPPAHFPTGPLSHRLKSQPVHRQRAKRQSKGLGDEQHPHIVPQPEQGGEGNENWFEVFGQTGLLMVAPGGFHKTPAQGIPHCLVNQRQVRGVGAQRFISLDGIPGEVEGEYEDESPKDQGWQAAGAHNGFW